MAAYKNFVQDFPVRCKDILELAESQAIHQEREVTLLLVVTSAAIVVPYERLRSDGRFLHPSSDRGRFAEASTKLDALLTSKFLGSALWNQEGAQSWKHEKLKSVTGDPDAWPGLDKHKPINKDKLTRSILKIIRNALAHGNVYTQGDSIKNLIFVSHVSDDRTQQIKEWQCIQVSPNDFKSFLNQWFHFIEVLDIPQAVVPESLQLAE